MTVMTHVIALEDGQSSQGTFGPITPVLIKCQNNVAVCLKFPVM